MKRTLRLLGLALLMVPSPAVAGGRLIAAEPVDDVKIRIDGDLREWPNKMTDLGDTLEGKPSGGDPRVAATVAYDENSLYVVLKVFDQKIVRIDGYAMNMVQGSAALVYDNTLFGYTSPFAGQWYRFELAPVWGDLRYVDALADYRRYLFARPVTLALQAVHSGRYGRDSEGVVNDQQIFYDQYLGQPWFVRGYYGVYNDCGRESGEGPTCDVLGQLLGSRVGVARAELRFPLFKQLVVGPGVGFPPVEGFGFFDAGVAWTNATRPTLTRGIPSNPLDRGVISSAGVGARVNLFGYMVAELDYLRAFALENGWRWQFNLLPGY